MDGETSIRLDAALSGTAGLVLAAGAPALDGPLGIRVAVLVPLGLLMLVYAGGLALVVRGGAAARAVRTVGLGNVLWVALSLAVLAAGWLTPTTAGAVAIVAQAAAVAALAAAQLRAARAPSSQTSPRQPRRRGARRGRGDRRGVASGR